MKKILFIFLLAIFLSGCKKSPIIVYQQKPIELAQSFSSLLPTDTGYYQKPRVSISQGVGRVVQGLNENPNIQHTRIKKSENGEVFFESTEAGYIYNYTYSDLKVRITTPPLYTPYFFTKTVSPIFQRNGTIIYSSGSNNFGAEYLQILDKPSEVSLYEQVKKYHLSSGCQIDLLTGVDLSFLSNHNLIGAVLSDTSHETNTCIQDKEFPTNTSNIVFLMDPKKSNTYYKISFGSDCAPGPCSIFGQIDFF